ncbi:MAG TPA: hypothetical protein VKC34_15400, partial [Blastocatellia bacterium]|nr:hypothetical protein [Blastocatellia bacterium]
MKKCTDCGLPYDDQFSFCPEDGAPLIPSGDEDRPAGEPIEQPTISEVITGTAPVQSSARGNSGGPAYEAGPSQLLRCPGCGAEYPRTFASCPIDGFKLTSPIIPAAPAFEPLPAAEGEGSLGEGDVDPSESPHRTQPLVNPPVDSSDLKPTADHMGNESQDTGPLAHAMATGELPGSSLGSPEGPGRRSFSDPFGRQVIARGKRASSFPKSLILLLVGIFALAGLYLLLGGGRAERQMAPALKTAQGEGGEK